ncbi:MAG: LVIVD repeat-containing protein [Longimicrobiaceae bacterium]
MSIYPVRFLALAALAALAACDSPSGSEPDDGKPVEMSTLGLGAVPERVTSELWVRGQYGYTGTHVGPVAGNVIKVWNVSGNKPVLVDSLHVPGPPPAPAAVRFHMDDEEDGHEHAAGPDRIGDIQASDDGRLLVAATEGGPGSIVIYDLANPAHPAFLTRYADEDLRAGVHTAEVARVDGTLYAFLSIDPSSSLSLPPRLVIVDLTDPRAPRKVFSRVMGRPYQHDVFVRDGILFTAMWHDGVGIWDIGGGGRGGTVASPVLLSTILTVSGYAHNVYWLRDPSTGTKRWLFVGQEQPIGGGQYRGDVHVVDVRDLTAPREVAFFRVEGAGTHNFSVDEGAGVLYAAFYNAGVRALDVRGDLSACSAAEKAEDGRCDLSLMHREAGRGLDREDRAVMIWGVHYQDGKLYASDLFNGLWKLDASKLR